MAAFNTMPKREKLCNYVADRSQPRNSFSKLRRELASMLFPRFASFCVAGKL